MTKANECTCPSGDGSLRHPCPAHPASVELAGVGAKLTFINGRPAMCGCQVEYSSGGGEYSDVIDVTLCAKHSGSAILDLVATNRIALTPEYEGQWHADLYLDREIPLAKAEGATPAEAVLALMSAERIDPEQESVEQAGGDERDLQGAQGERDGWGPLPIFQVPWNVFDRAVMWVEDRRRYGDDGTIVDDWKALKTIQRAALAQPSPAPADEKPGDSILCYGCFAKGVGPEHFDEAGKCLARQQTEPLGAEFAQVLSDNLPELLSTGQAEQAEAERPEVVGYLLTKGNGTLSILRAGPSDEPVMTVAQHERIVAFRWERAMDLMGEHVARISEKLTAERDAALAKVAGLELKLDQSDYAYDNDRCHMRGLAKQAAEAIQVFTGHDSSANLAHRYGEKWWEHLDELRDALLAFAKNAPVAQPEEMPGEILAAKLIETWVTKHGKPAPWSTAVEITAVATNMPNDERDRLLALDDDVDAQAQHSVPEEFIGRLSEFLAQRGATGKALLRELRTVLASAPGKEGL
ncbi:TPA: hypothetical protein SMO11_005376 [Pseudomonas aeruginosa]|nr:hypothetical protein [Pseudomonas aeruginosa]HEJ9986282.1 hypothetical protein [Pseudomonas aeruginosa]